MHKQCYGLPPFLTPFPRPEDLAAGKALLDTILIFLLVFRIISLGLIDWLPKGRGGRVKSQLMLGDRGSGWLGRSLAGWLVGG